MQPYSEQKPSVDSTQTEIFEESQDDNQLENEQVDQSTSSSVSEVSDITEEAKKQHIQTILVNNKIMMINKRFTAFIFKPK